ncbi:MAG: hypothetical protein IJB04_04405 [Oscillospiraceae bacterium]|nr:hypothetical protein [Oscillospiraceae bacterium]
MPDYKKMYLTLFHATEEVIDLLSLLPPPLSERELRRKVKQLLTEAQQAAEDIYIDTCDEE